MLQVNRSDVRQSPFPHVISDSILEPETYRALRRDFPDTRTFAETSADVGTRGSRTGSGFDIYRGDPAYSALVQRSEAWRGFDAWINSDAFVDKFVELFGPDLDDLGMRVDLSRSRLNPDHIEPRSALTANDTMLDKTSRLGSKIADTWRGKRSAELFTRLDISKSAAGYAKAPHCDRPNRLCSLIIYFCDADAIGLEGGELKIFSHKQSKDIRDYERHPREADVDVVAQLKPKENLGVFFPCSNNSYHGVTAVTSTGAERDFIYVNITGRQSSIWY